MIDKEGFPQQRIIEYGKLEIRSPRIEFSGVLASRQPDLIHQSSFCSFTLAHEGGLPSIFIPQAQDLTINTRRRALLSIQLTDLGKSQYISRQFFDNGLITIDIGFPQLVGRQSLLSAEQFLERHRLTPREIEILQNLAQEKTAIEVADLLAISPETVRTHMKNINTKIGVSRISTSIVKAALAGIITVEE